MPAEEFVATQEYTKMSFELPGYTNQNVRVKISLTRAAGIDQTVCFFIDDFSAGTQLSHDLSISGFHGPSMSGIGQKCIYTATVSNNGPETESAYSLRLCNRTGTELHAIPGTELAAGTSQSFELEWTPGQAGTDSLYAEVVSEQDQLPANNRSSKLAVEVLEDGFSLQPGTPGNGLNLFNPLGFEYKYYVSQALYTGEEMNYTQGFINTLIYEGKFQEDLESNLCIWLGETSLPNLFRQSVSPDALTKVFEGKVQFPEGDHRQIAIPLQQNYEYKGGNLIVYVSAQNDTAYGVTSDKGSFYSENTSTGAVVLWHVFSDTELDPENPASMEDLRSQSTSRPNLSLLMDSEESIASYSLRFNVKDENGTPVEGATITLNDSTYPAGTYVFDSLPAGGYTYTVSKTDYSSVSGHAGIVNQDVSIEVELRSLSGIPYISNYFVEDFDAVDAGSRPSGWSGNFYVEDKNGIGDSKHLTHSFWFMDGARFINTHPVFMGNEPVFEFAYRVMDRETYPENAYNGKNMSYKIKVSKDLGNTWVDLYTEDYGTHTASKEYQTRKVDVSAYANEVCVFQLEVTRDYNLSDEFYFDIDNWRIGTIPEKDLGIPAPIQAVRIASVGQEALYKVTVANTGKEAQGPYTLQLMAGDKEIGSVEGAVLDSGAKAVHEFLYTPDQTGNFSLSARLTNPEDQVSINDHSQAFHLSVQEEGVSISNFDFYEGNDLVYTDPCNFHVPYSLSQILYPQEEIELPQGEALCGIAWKTRFSSALERQKVTIWIGETDSSFISAHYMLPVSSMQKVFEGALDISDKDGDNLVIPFQTPYQWQGKHLVICTYKEAETAEPYESNCYFYGKYMLGTVRSFSISSETAMDLESLETNMGSSSFTYPSTVFLSRSDIESYTVSFQVVNERQEALSGAVIEFNGRELEAGQYIVTEVFNGEYPYRVTYGGNTQEGSVTVDGADVTETVVFNESGNEFDLDKNMIKIYPNPSTGRFFVEHSQACKEICVYDIYGKQVCRYAKVDAGVLEVDLSGHRSGIYLMMVDDQAFKITKR